MATQNAKVRQRGSSLVEFMVASLLGLIALGIVGNVFISGKKAATERSKELLLLQNMTSVMQQMKEDLLRAGYNGVSAGSSILSGAAYAIHTQTDPEMLGFVYRVASSGSSAYRSVIYKYKPLSPRANLIQLCEKHYHKPLTPASAAKSGFQGVCYNLFDPKQITIDSFNVSIIETVSNSISSAFSVISMSASLVNDASVTHSMVIKVQQRNW